MQFWICSLKYFANTLYRTLIYLECYKSFLSITPYISRYKSFDSNYRHFIPRRDSFPIIFFFVQTTINLPRFVPRPPLRISEIVTGKIECITAEKINLNIIPFVFARSSEIRRVSFVCSARELRFTIFQKFSIF